MFYSDKNMGKIKRSNKPFERKKKAPWNKGISKRKNTQKNFLHKGKKSWFDHEEES